MNKCRTRLMTCCLLLGVFGSGLGPTNAADASNGERLAQRWCASCHVISSGQKGPVNEAPPFASIAKSADFSPAKLALFLLDPHPKMPNMTLSRNEAADLAAFVARLK